MEHISTAWVDYAKLRLPSREIKQLYRSWINLMMLAAESQQVIWLRTMRLAAGGATAESEARLMVNEKVLTASLESGRLIMGASAESVVKRYRTKVKANLRRLSK